MTNNFYETDQAVSEYLLFHYGLTKDLLPVSLAGSRALNFTVRCVEECLEASRLPAGADSNVPLDLADYNFLQDSPDSKGLGFRNA